MSLKYTPVTKKKKKTTDLELFNVCSNHTPLIVSEKIATLKFFATPDSLSAGPTLTIT